MDYLNKFTGDNQNSEGNQNNQSQSQEGNQQQSSEKQGGFLGGLGDKLNSAAGGGKESEKNEDMLDKGTPLLPSQPNPPPRK